MVSVTSPRANGQPRPRALFLTPEAPYPLHGGGAYRTASLLHYLSSRYDVEFVGFQQPGAAAPFGNLPAGLGEPVGVIPLRAHSRSVPARVFRNVVRAVRGAPPLNDRFSGYGKSLEGFLAGRSYDVAVLEHFWVAGYAGAISHHAKRLVLDLHNIESEFYASSAKEAGPLTAPLLRRFAHAAERMETVSLQYFDRILTPSRTDSEKIRGRHPLARVEVYPNAIPWRPRPEVTKEDVLIFAGNLEYAPNQDAIRFFASRVWPQLRTRWKNLRWEVVGRNPEAVASVLAGLEGVDLVGPVEDAFSRIARAKLSLVPIAWGSGTRVKILESWAAGTPVVSTTAGAEGLDAVSGEHLQIADGASDFVATISHLLGSTESRLRLAAAGRRFYEEQFTWEAAWRHLKETGL